MGFDDTCLSQIGIIWHVGTNISGDVREIEDQPPRMLNGQPINKRDEHQHPWFTQQPCHARHDVVYLMLCRNAGCNSSEQPLDRDMLIP